MLVSVAPRHTGIASGCNSAVSRIGGLFATVVFSVVVAVHDGQMVHRFHIVVLLEAAANRRCGRLRVRVGQRARHRTARGLTRRANPNPAGAINAVGGSGKDRG